MAGKTGRMHSGLEPTIRPTMRDIAWAVGIYEGEGSCNISSGNCPQVSVHQRERWLCDRLRSFFGGSVRPFTCKPAVLPDGKMYGIRRQFTWCISGARARGFLMTVYGRVSPRRRSQIARVMRWSRVAGHHPIAYLRPLMRDIAWAAGIYEGEGTCQKTSSGSPSIQVSQKDPWLLDRLRTNFRGSISSYNNRGRKHHRWILTGPKARGFLMTIYDFLSPHRKAQALRVMA